MRSSLLCDAKRRVGVYSIELSVLTGFYHCHLRRSRFSIFVNYISSCHVAIFTEILCSCRFLEKMATILLNRGEQRPNIRSIISFHAVTGLVHLSNLNWSANLCRQVLVHCPTAHNVSVGGHCAVHAGMSVPASLNSLVNLWVLTLE